MRVMILHQKFNKFSGNRDGYEVVAAVDADPANPAAQGGLMGALEYAWARSQNIWGSWSKGEFHEDGEPNEDYSPNVKVVAKLPMVDGRELGLRSSMVGDLFIAGGAVYKAADFGFEKVVDLDALLKVEA